MWTWTCTGCGQTFTREQREDAQQEFFDHVRIAHPKAYVVSVARD